MVINETLSRLGQQCTSGLILPLIRVFLLSFQWLFEVYQLTGPEVLIAADPTFVNLTNGDYVEGVDSRAAFVFRSPVFRKTSLCFMTAKRLMFGN